MAARQDATARCPGGPTRIPSPLTLWRRELDSEPEEPQAAEPGAAAAQHTGAGPGPKASNKAACAPGPAGATTSTVAEARVAETQGNLKEPAACLSLRAGQYSGSLR
jgi:hypothetical protein